MATTKAISQKDLDFSYSTTNYQYGENNLLILKITHYSNNIYNNQNNKKPLLPSTSTLHPVLGNLNQQILEKKST